MCETLNIRTQIQFKKKISEFPDGPVVKNLSLSAGDTGLIPDPGRFHKSQSNEARVPQH